MAGVSCRRTAEMTPCRARPTRASSTMLGVPAARRRCAGPERGHPEHHELCAARRPPRRCAARAERLDPDPAVRYGQALNLGSWTTVFLDAAASLDRQSVVEGKSVDGG